MAEHDICCRCVRHYLREKIEADKETSIPCPVEKCTEILDFNEIKLRGSNCSFFRFLQRNSDLRRLDQMLLEEALLSIPNFRKCRKVGCKNGEIIEDCGIHPQ